MKKIIPVKSLIPYSLVIAFCGMLIAANINIILAVRYLDNLDLLHANQNFQVRTLANLEMLKISFDLILKIIAVVSAIFIFATLSAIVETHTSKIATLLLLGANKCQVTTILFSALALPFSIATIIGAAIGALLSYFEYFFVHDWFVEGFTPNFHFQTIIYTALIVFALIILAFLANLRKLLSINPLRIASGKNKELSSLSIPRLIAGIGMTLYCVWFYLYSDNSTDMKLSFNLLHFGEYIVVAIYLLVPVLLKICMPVIFIVVSKIFPISGLLAKRYFNASIRRYVTIAAPIIVCLVWVSIFVSVASNVQSFLTKAYQDNVSAQAVASKISLKNNFQWRQYISQVAQIDKNITINPVLSDDRWAETNNTTENPKIWELDPRALSRIVKNLDFTGDLNKVGGDNVASNRAQDQIGETLHLISPAGKHLNIHIVAKIGQSLVLGGFTSLFADYKTFPETNTNPHLYDIFYSGITSEQLNRLGLSAIPYDIWMHKMLNNQFQSRNLGLYFRALPLVFISFALLIINSSSVSSNSRYIRRVISTIGGTSSQDIRIFAIEFVSVFLLSSAVMMIPINILHKFFARFARSVYNMDPSLVRYSYHTNIITLVALILAASFIPVIKTIRLNRK